MGIRLVVPQDIAPLLTMLYEINDLALYSRGLQLDSNRMSHIMARSINQPETGPCFICEDNGVYKGMLFGFVVDTFFTDQRWFEERVFYVRKQHRTMPLAIEFIRTVERWCERQGIARIELGNGFTRDTRINKLYSMLGYEHVNTIYAKGM